MRAAIEGKPKSTVIWSAVVAVALLSSFGLGYWVASSKLGTQLTKTELQLARATARAKVLQSQLVHLRGRQAQLEARRALHLALLQLDQRNFGFAQSQLKRARQHLAAAPAGVRPVAKTLAQINVLAAGDFSAQRDHVLDDVRKLDQLIDLNPPPDEP